MNHLHERSFAMNPQGISMNPYTDIDKVTRIFDNAAAEGRWQLYEYENYSLLDAAGSESTPRSMLIAKGSRISNEQIDAFPGEKVVLKIVSPYIVHKSDVGGVQVVEKTPGKVRSGYRRMMDQVKENYSAYLESQPHLVPEPYAGLKGPELRQAVGLDIKGVLICEYMPPDSASFGNELIVSLRLTREFGMIITTGLGGTDTELYAERFKDGQAVVSASTELVSGPEFFQLFQKTIAYEKLAGHTRGGSRVVSDEQLLECLTNFVDIGNYYSPLNPEAPYVIHELELNPIAFSDYLMVPLDGLCRFSKPIPQKPARDLERIDKLLHAKSLAIVGVSSSKVNYGRQILRNMLDMGYDRTRIKIISPSAKEVEGVACVPDLKALGQVDLLVIAVAAAQTPALIDEIIEGRHAESVILIPGGMGETAGSQERAREVIARISQAHARPGGGPVFLGGNCLGVISHPARLDTFFAPDTAAPKDRSQRRRNTALISQSGGFALIRMMKLCSGDPLYNITVGNQMDLTIGDLVNHLKGDERVEVIGIYAEGFKDLDGLHLARGIRGAVRAGKEVVVYKAGRTPEGKLATSGHTASVAGDYHVCVACLEQAGALVAHTIAEFDGLLNLATVLHGKKVNGNRVMGIGSAGFEAVGMADHLQSHGANLELARLSGKSQDAMMELLAKYRLDSIVDVRNPFDLTPAANDDLHAEAIATAAADEGVDSLVVSFDTMSPVIKDTPIPGSHFGYTDSPDSYGHKLVELSQSLDKPLVVFNDVGWMHQPLNYKLEKAGVPVFGTSGQAMAALARYTSYRLYIAKIRQPG
jgi:acyl-CoA synthetase (NDP forming)